MITENFRRLILSLLSKQIRVSDLYGENPLKDENGTVFDAYTNFEGTNLFNYLTGAKEQIKLAVGKGMTQPTKDDYKLEDKVMEVSLEEIILEHVNDLDVLTLQSRFYVEQTFKTSETGFFMQIKDVNGTLRWILLNREVFTPVTWRKDFYYFIAFRLIV